MHRVFVTLSLAVVVLAVACQDELDVPTTGTIVLNVQFDDTEPAISTQSVGTGGTGVRVSMSPRFNAPSYSSVRATAEGPSTRTSNLVLTDGFWEGEITGLEPGSYTVTVEAFTNGELQEIGSTSGVSVTAGVSSSASVSLRSFAPSLNAIGAPGTIMGFAVSWGAVTGATGYRVEWSKASDFAGARNQTLDSTVTLISVSDTGTWNVRVRATAPGVTGVPSAARQVTVNAEAAGISGDDAGSAPLLGFGTAITQTIGQLNIAPASDEDWFVFDACLADTIIVQTRAATLTVPSGLNTQLDLFNSAATQVASNNDDGMTTDSRIEIDLPADDSYAIRVTGVSGTTGHYQIEIDLRAGPNNTGVVCVQPTVNTVTVTPGSFSLDAIGATQQLTAEARDINNNVIAGVQYTWDSDDPGVATVDANGLVTSVGNGTANITATSVPLASAAEEAVTEAAAGDAEEREAPAEGAKPRVRGRAAAASPPPARIAANQPAGSAAVTVAQAPAAVVLTPPTASLTFINETTQLTADVQDRLGVSIAGAAVGWSSDLPGIASVDNAGLVTAVDNGSAVITAAFDTVASTSDITVQQTAAAVVKTGGDGQVGFAGTTLGAPLAVRVDDAGGTGIAGVQVDWTIATGGGGLSAGTTTTDGSGATSVTWTLGAAAGLQSVDVSAAGFNDSFNATAVAGAQWTNPAGGLWSVGSNWSTGVAPGPGDSVLIGLDGSYQVNLTAPTTVAFLQITGGGAGPQALEMAANDLTVTGNLTMSGRAVLIVSGAATVTADSIFNGGDGITAQDGTINTAYITSSGSIAAFSPGVSINVTDGFVHDGFITLMDNSFLGISGAPFTGTGNAIFSFGNLSTLDVTVPSASFQAPIVVAAGTFILDTPSGTAAAAISVAAGADLDLTNTTITVDSLDNAGDVSLDNTSITGPVTNSGYLAAFAGGNTITGQVYTTTSSAIEVADAGTELTVSPGFTNNGNISMTATLSGSPVRLLLPGGTLVNSPTGTIDFFDIAADINADTLDNQGNINVTGVAGAATTASTVTNGGDITVDDGEFTVFGNLTNLSGGTVTVERSSSLLVIAGGSAFDNQGFLQGGGTVDVTGGASFTSSGRIGVGPSFTPDPNVMTILGDATLQPGSVLEIEIGLQPASIDRLDVSGTLNLDGELNVIDNGLDRTYGNRYQVITWGGGFTSGFSDVSSLDLGGGFYLRQDISGIDLTLEVSVPQVVVTPGSGTITQLGGTLQLSAEAQEFDSTPIAGVSFTWSSSNPTVADVDATGLVTALNTGAATITATADGGTTGTSGITVMAAPVATVTVTGEGATIDGVGNVIQYGAEVRDSSGNIIAVPVTWTSLNTNVATVDGTGLVTAVGPGQTAVQAQADTASGYGMVTVVVAGLAQANVFADDGSPTMENIQDVWGSGADDVYAVGTNGTVVHWDGNAWSLVDIGAGTLSLTAVGGLSPSHVWIGAGTGEVFEFDGMTWTQLPAQGGGGVTGIWAHGPNNVWISLPAGNVAVWLGNGWTQTNTGQAEDLFTIWGSSAVDIWAAGRNGALVHFNGTSWAPVASGTGQNIRDIWGAAGDDIWAVANLDTLLNYGGTNWSASTTGTGTSFSNIWGLDRQDIYATGSNGLNEEIWHYDGLGWTLIATFDVTVNGALQGLVGTPNPSLVAVSSAGGILRGYLGANVVVTPADPTIIAPEDAVQLTATITDGGGNPIPSATVAWTSSNQGVFPVDATGLVSSTVDGLVGTITATAPGGASDATSVTSDWSFTGFVTAVAGAFAERVTFAPGNVAWDGDEFITVSGEQPWLEFQSLDSIVILIPDLPAGSQTFEIQNQGPGQYSQFATFNMTTPFARFSTGTAPNISGNMFPQVLYVSLEDDAGDPTASIPDGIDDHYWTVDPAANQGLRVTLEWQTGADLDIYWTDNVGTCCNGNFDGAGFSNPEISGEVIPTAGDWRLHINKFDRGTPRVMARVTIEQTTVGTAITAGRFHTCGINIDGGAQCWGSNNDGQLGDGTNFESAFPNDISGLELIDIDAGDFHTCAIDTSGAAWCWGRGSSGQLGSGSFASSNAPIAVTGGLSFTKVTAGASHSCGLTGGGDIHCWGNGQFGQLGNGGTAFETSPVQANGGPYSDLAAGGNHTCAIDTFGAAFCWGNNFSGQLGDGTTTQSLIPVAVVPVAMRTFAQITAGSDHTCAIMDNGDAYCWGTGSASGSGSPTQSSTPALVTGGFSYTAIDAGTLHTCAVTTLPEVRCWGQGEFGKLGDGSATDIYSPIAVAVVAVDVTPAAGGDHSCMLDDNGDAFCWGRNSNGQLGDGTTLTNTPQSVSSGAFVVDITSGDQFTCRQDIGNAVQCWGNGGSGQLGNGVFNSSVVPVTVTGGISWALIDAGDDHVCGVDATGLGYCWGQGSSGQLGDNFFTSKANPARVADTLVGVTSWAKIAAGGRHSCGIESATGFLWCWGENNDGQLGIGTMTDAAFPQQVWDPTGTGPWSQAFIDVDGGPFHTCAVTTAGDMYCWGFNGVGELGNGTSGSGSSSDIPVLVTGGFQFQTVDLGRQYSCGATTTNLLYCWGGNGGGQFGNGTGASSTTPTLGAGGQTFAAFGASSGAFDGHNCGIDDVSFELYCFGNNAFGQLGDLSQADQLSPVLVSGGFTWNAIGPSRDHTCAVTGGGVTYCWGDNSQGFLGIGTQHREVTPVAVLQDNPFQVRAGGGVAAEPVKPRPSSGAGLR